MIIKNDPRTEEQYLSIVGVSNKSEASVAETKVTTTIADTTTTFMQDAVKYEVSYEPNPNGVPGTKKVVTAKSLPRYKPGLVITNLSRGKVASCDLQNGYQTSVGTVSMSGTECRQCIAVTKSGSTVGEMQAIRCSSVPPATVVGITDTAGGATVSDDCLYYQGANGKNSINGQGTPIYVNGFNKTTYTFEENGRKIYRRCENGRWISGKAFGAR